MELANDVLIYKLGNLMHCKLNLRMQYDFRDEIYEFLKELKMTEHELIQAISEDEDNISEYLINTMEKYVYPKKYLTKEILRYIYNIYDFVFPDHSHDYFQKFLGEMGDLLYYAINNGFYELIEDFADIGYTNFDHCAPLIAAINGRAPLSIFERLLELGADTEDSFGDNHDSDRFEDYYPALFKAIEQLNLEVVTFLLDHGASTFYDDYNGKLQAVTFAITFEGQVADQILQTLIEHNADVNKSFDESRGHTWNTPIEAAIFQNSIYRVEMLILAGADFSHNDNGDYDPYLFNMAVMLGNFDLIVLLLDPPIGTGADPTVLDSKGQNFALQSLYGNINIDDFPHYQQNFMTEMKHLTSQVPMSTKQKIKNLLISRGAKP